jgi:hypothetical protein
VPFFVLTSAIIHSLALKISPTAEMKEKLLYKLASLEEMASYHGFALRAIDALRYLAGRWSVDVFTGEGGGKGDDKRSVLLDAFSMNVGIREVM